MAKMTIDEAKDNYIGRWIYDGDCMITSCCNTVYDINKFERKGELTYLPCNCPNCGADLRCENGSG